ncbi:translation initiation factor IF-2 [Paraprevotella xylaniphila YIT 11841]|uniref:Translation initiation factor IF-2 n=1 Tax=Paraprevotella xylaniphila YIT 11841 TaxID=762982 RepID=F3QWY5_9BACT|nr:translation initiation factor IF-2 [Paraprevotella xylaniphila]EGG51435.1 translation initiation factor IF-2 [Paraprevotella xylaniphila YIT 11841]
MSIRLNKVTKECNVGLQTAVEFLQKKGFSDVEANPNTKISDEQYQMLVAEFKKDKGLRDDAAAVSRKRQHKEKKATIALPEEKPVEIKTATEARLGKGPKVVGHIDLDNLGARGPVAAPEKKEAPVPARPAEAKAEAPVAGQEPKQAGSPQAGKEDSVDRKAALLQERSNAIGTETDGVFRLNHTAQAAPQLKVKGHIDLSALNQSTRPKKKTKEEKRKEREEKNRQAGGDRPRQGGGGQNASESKKKRVRIGKERVDVNAVAGQQNGKKRDNAPGANGQGGGKHNKNKNRQQPVIKAEVSDEDVAKQVKETLARLTNKSKAGKGAKYRKEKRENARASMEEQLEEQAAESKVLKLTEFVTANELAVMMDVPVTKVIGTCMSIGIMVSINQRLDAETINLVAEEFGFKTEYVSAEVSEAVNEEEDDEEDLMPRAPIVTVMGHVDHGKTSLLDYIRNANVIAGEAGGITQHIGAYNVTLEDGRHITFLDTPGHEAFTAMRARGAQVTDIAIIIIAADDDIMPQTKEAINHAMAAGVPIVFAINKVDKPAANPDKIKEGLAAMNFLVEDWGGKYQSQDISAKKGIGVEELLEKVLLEAEMLDLKANPNRKATGSIIESSLDKGRGYVATVLVSNGTLHVGDIVLAGTNYGRVKAMFNERNQRVKEIGPAQAATVLGLDGAPTAGDTFHVMDTEQEAREITNKRVQLQREQGLRTQKILTLDEVGRRIALGGFQELNVIVKGDVDGSIEALSDSLIKLSTEKIAVNVIHKGVGQISESDVALAAASEAIIIGFQVRPSASARKMAEQQGVDIRLYSIIYDAIEEVKSAMEGMLAPEVKEEVTATVEVRQVYHISKVGTVAGAYVVDGKVQRSNKARVIRDGIVVHTGQINALKRFKDDVKEVGTNFECGISLVNYNDLREGDMIETYQEVEVKAKL